MDTEQLSGIKTKLVGGVVALASRTILLQAISFGATFFLTILLSTEAFGVFFLVSAVISFLSYFSDIGFAAALVQRHEEPTRHDYVTAFSIQQLLVGGLVLLGLFFSKQVAIFYRFDAQATFLLQALLVSFFLSSLKTIPSILLERRLDFTRLVIPQIVETIAFYGVTIWGALAGLGIASFAWGALARGVSGTIAIYIISPWRPGFGINRPSFRHLISFGLPFQFNSMLALVKDDLVTMLLGRILPLAQIGYIGWAKKWAEAPLRIIMDNVIRVTFPAYSRLQTDTALLRRAIERSFFFLAYCIFPTTVLMIVCIHPMILLIPKYAKWEPAVISFYLFAVASLFSAFSSPVVNALNATGKIKTTLSLMIFWTALTWAVIPLAVYLFGYQGVALGAAIISLTGVIPVMLLYRQIPFTFFPVIIKPLVSALSIGVIAWMILSVAQTMVHVVLAVVVSGLIYAALSMTWMKEELRPYIAGIRIWRT